MRISDFKPQAVEGDRFDVNDNDVSQQPDLEDDPSHPEDIMPDHLEAMPGAEASEEEEEEVTARPSEANRVIPPDLLP